MSDLNFLGIDGGGTRCRARIRDPAGRCLGAAEGDLANIYQDFGGAMAAVVETAREASKLAGLPALDGLHAGLGLAGVMTAEAIERIAGAKLPFGRLSIDSDAYVACIGAHRHGDGGIIIAGTGSAALALIGGQRHTLGGRGFALGDDGSAAQLGRRAMRLAVLAMDGLVTDSPLLAELRRNLKDDWATLSRWSKKARPKDFAALAPVVFAAADRGDLHGHSLVDDCAGALARMARVLIAKGAGNLSLIGGMAASVSRYLPADVCDRLVPPHADPVDGAIMMARRAAGLEAAW
ncbi:MAG: N-acetylglucosamine kinase [Pseudomonadota bacterium]|nr:N-acetylglucosamine kinase [Pseudomonadota bacterium]